MKMFDRRIALASALLIGLAGCSSDDGGPSGPMTDEEAELTTLIRDTLPLHPLPDTVPYPPDNHPGEAAYAARVELGRQMFFDPILSGNDDIACGHCHHPAFAWADGRGLSIGVGGTGLGPDRERGLPRGDADLEEWEFFTPRNSPTILDAGRIAPPEGGGDGPWDGRMFWDGRTSSLESQARAPIRSRDEMRADAYHTNDAVNEVLNDLAGIEGYQQRFEAAFPGELETIGIPLGTEPDHINANTYARAIAAYERELFTADSPYDAFARGDDEALTLEQKKGLLLFHQIGCVQCHAGATFSDFDFRALGVKQGGPGRPPIHERGDGSDVGRFAANETTGVEENRWAFRTPSLRNVELTAPYFHTGGVGTPGDADYQTLRQVVEFFDRGGNDEGLPADSVHPFVRPLGLEDVQIDALVAFLQSLTATRLGSEVVDPTVPATVPSELTPPPVLPPVLTN